MKSIYGFLIKPVGERYSNIKKVGDKELVLNTDIYNHKHTNREAEVLSIPKIGKTDIKVGEKLAKRYIYNKVNEPTKEQKQKALEKIYDEIDMLEKSEIEVREFIKYKELYGWFLIPGLIIGLSMETFRRSIFRSKT